MAGPTVLIFHRPASTDDPGLVRLLADARRRLADDQVDLFRRAGAGGVRLCEQHGASFGELLRAHSPKRGGVVVMGSGAVPRLTLTDARRLVATAATGGRSALCNNRYSSDVCALGDARDLAGLPALPTDNALPRWLEEHAGYRVRELPSRDRLALDIDTPLDIGLWALATAAPRWVSDLVDEQRLGVPRSLELRRLAQDPHAELLVFGRAGSSTMRWLERNVRCRVRFLAEERGLRASTPLAIGGSGRATDGRPPRATLGLLLERDGPGALDRVVAQLADGAIIDSRVLLAHRSGADEAAWPSPADRYASDLLRAADISDRWLRELTASAGASRGPVVLGAHTLVGPGVRLLLGASRGGLDA
ncbi:MAG TPA: hypothetical protein VM305_00315 [Candidatus Limnocylindrales bacterium]|nr:hypothetical protein [Candidatus Limnocylindrales bacterium]